MTISEWGIVRLCLHAVGVKHYDMHRKKGDVFLQYNFIIQTCMCCFNN